MTRAMDPEVADAIWAAIEPILPIPLDDHPLGCHNPRVPDKVCFRGILIRLVTGSSWVDIEAVTETVDRTGVEMEALTACSVAALTVYDMCKALDRSMQVESLGLHEKSGGRSGDWRRAD